MANYFWPQEFASWDDSQNEGAENGGGSAGASRSHSETEKRRRDRINARLATLKNMIPKSEKMDKAALLGHVVEHVNELSAKAKESCNFSNIPSEIDEVTVDYINEEGSQYDENVFIKASICCDDRPELFAELSSSFNELGLTIVQSDLTSLGGRTKSNFVLCAVRNSSRSSSSLKQSLKLVLSRLAISSATSTYCARSKRYRFFCNDA